MRFFSTIVTALAVAQGALAVDVQKSIIVSFPEGTPDDVVSRAKDDIRKAGGVVTHDYKLFRGFSAHAPQKVVESVTAWATEYQGTIEEDQVVTISENGPSL